MTHRDGLPHAFGLGFSARSAWRGDAGHRKPRAPSTSIGPSESLEKPPPVARANRQWAPVGASAGLDDAPHRRRLPSCPPIGPSHRLRDLYGSLSTLLGIAAREPG